MQRRACGMVFVPGTVRRTIAPLPHRVKSRYKLAHFVRSCLTEPGVGVLSTGQVLLDTPLLLAKELNSFVKRWNPS